MTEATAEAEAPVAVDAESLRAFCRERLASCKVPVHFRWSRALPRTAVGKLRRAALRAEVQARGWPGTYG